MTQLSSELTQEGTIKSGRLWSQALKLTLPILFAFFPIGLAFGFLDTEQGIPWPFVCLMSFLVYAGSSEFVAASMMSAGDPVLKVALTGFLINLRHVFYGLSVIGKIPEKGLVRSYLIATLSDETYALIASLPVEDRELSPKIALLNHVYWFGSVAVGTALGTAFNFPFKGLDFCLTALFAVLTIEQWHSLKKPGPFVIAAVSGGVAYLIAPGQLLVVSLAVATVLLLISIRRKK